MRPVNEKLAADLLEAGKQEFLEKGFQGASMRGIASRLSVTTGALYRYYTDKESLFDVLVEEPARVLEERYRAIQRNFADQPVKDQVQAVQNFKNAAHYDLKTVKIVMPDGTACSVVKAAKRIIDAMEAFFDDFGTSVHECLAFQRLKFEDPHTRYAWKIREEYGQGFVARGLQLARKLQKGYVE